MSFLPRILNRLGEKSDHPFVVEARGSESIATTGTELLSAVRRARGFVRRRGLARGDRCALLAANSAAWVAADLALLAEGVLVVPLYARQQPDEIGRILVDSGAKVFLCDEPALGEAARRRAPGVPAPIALEEVVSAGDDVETGPPVAAAAGDPAAILYTSGTSGEPKGAVVTHGNVDFVLQRTIESLDALMGGAAGPERVVHYLPWCFAGAWIALLAGLHRRAVLTVNTDPSHLVDDLRTAQPHWFQNVPLVLERIREGVERGLANRGGLAASFFAGAMRAAQESARGQPTAWLDGVRLTVCRRAVFPKIRERLGSELRALVCGSAPLDPETQAFFEMLGVPVLQVYGLTETTAICTLDRPGEARPGRVGRAIEGVEMRVEEDGEILVRGPNVFAGYWNREAETASAFTDGWFRTGDLGEVDPDGTWRVLGRTRSVLVLQSGHNVAPEPIESALASLLPEARQIVLVGQGRPYVAAIVTGEVTRDEAERAAAALNEHLPHYQRIRACLVRAQPFTPEAGLLTATGKVRAGAVRRAMAGEIDELYAVSGTRA